MYHKKITKIFILNLHFQKLLNILFENISLNCCIYNKYLFLLITVELQKMLPHVLDSFLRLNKIIEQFQIRRGILSSFGPDQGPHCLKML